MLALAAVVGLLIGVVGTGLVVTTLFSMERGISDGVAQSMNLAQEGALPEDVGPSGPVTQFSATAPGNLGPDPVLNAYAQQCFDGDLQSCDDLYSESPPRSDYEDYAMTCAGRVKQYDVMYCTDLD
jgi:hypothetical protein